MKDRFWAKVDIRGPTECWPWKGHTRTDRYPNTRLQGKHYNPHRVAWFLTYGSFPEGENICHSCNNRACCNPVHLYPATDQENMEYAHRIGRLKGERGERNSQAKLTEGVVRWIRLVYVPGHPEFGAKPLGAKLGVGGEAISKIVQGVTWKHIPGVKKP